MNKTLAFILAMLGLNVGTACSQQDYKNMDVSQFAELITNENVQLVDVRTAEEFAEGHIDGALNIDVKLNDFLQKAKEQLDVNKPVAVYCRSGRRSANAANILAKEGFKATNLSGGILAWKEKQMPTTQDTSEMDVFKTKSGKSIKFYALMHACIRIVYDGKEIQIDPVGKLGERTVNYASMPKADYIFVTHEHRDHFDQGTIKQISKEQTRLITNKRCGEMLGYGEIIANGDKMEIAKDFTVEAVPAYNITEGHTQFHPKGRDNGYILTIDGLRIYIAGDTEDTPEMANIKDIDIAFLPCNQPFTMTVDQLLNAAQIIKPKVLFPYHYGQTDVKGTPAQLKDKGIDVRIRHYE